MGSVVIAAYNEASVIGRCLEALAADDGGLEVVVVPNGCSDSTADVARSFAGVGVIELTEAGKAGALNAGDEAAGSFPRAYLDADMSVGRADLERLFDVLRDGHALAVAPQREVAAAGCPLLVRAYFAVHRHLPVMANSLFGRGIVVLSEQGRALFTTFPDLVADDLFLDGLFGPGEKRVVEDVVSVVLAPRRTSDLYRRLVRVRRGNTAMRARAGTQGVPVGVTQSDRTAFLRVVGRRPWLAPAACCYAALTLAASWAARRGNGSAWARDESTRSPS